MKTIQLKHVQFVSETDMEGYSETYLQFELEGTLIPETLQQQTFGLPVNDTFSAFTNEITVMRFSLPGTLSTLNETIPASFLSLNEKEEKTVRKELADFVAKHYAKLLSLLERELLEKRKEQQVN